MLPSSLLEEEKKGGTVMPNENSVISRYERRSVQGEERKS
jgi:hypothetical protein